jgi:glucose/mannose transport system substrate-binding protein
MGRAGTVAKILTTFTLAASLLTPACGSDAVDDTSTSPLELYSWWTAPGEKEALQALLDIYQQEHPNTPVINATLKDVVNAQTQLQTRLKGGGQPPDAFQVSGGADIMQWVVYNGRDDADTKVEPLDSLVRSQNLLGVLPPSIVDAVSYNSKVYAIPLGVHRFNVLYYNKKILDANGLGAPRTMEEFFATAETLKAKGIVPLALGNKSGVGLTVLAFDGLFAASPTVNFRDSYLAGRENPADARVVSLLEDTAKIVSYSNSSRATIEWDQAAQMVVDGTAAMTVMGDWARGFFASKGLRPDVDFGEAPFPGTQGVFVYTTDAFTVPKGARNRQAALEFLTLVSSTKGENAFNLLKGSTPPRTDADLSIYDAFAKRSADDFRTSRLATNTLGITSLEFSLQLWTAMKEFGNDGNVDNVVNMLKNRYDMLKR